MRRCRKCGRPIRFKKLSSGKWKPTEPDGSDHFDRCRKETRENLTAEELEKLIARHSPVVTEGKHKEFYTGSVPPWDESLGDLICFEGCCGNSGSSHYENDSRL